MSKHVVLLLTILKYGYTFPFTHISTLRLPYSPRPILVLNIFAAQLNRRKESFFVIRYFVLSVFQDRLNLRKCGLHIDIIPHSFFQESAGSLSPRPSRYVELPFYSYQLSTLQAHRWWCWCCYCYWVDIVAAFATCNGRMTTSTEQILQQQRTTRALFPAYTSHLARFILNSRIYLERRTPFLQLLGSWIEQWIIFAGGAPSCYRLCLYLSMLAFRL